MKETKVKTLYAAMLTLYLAGSALAADPAPAPAPSHVHEHGHDHAQTPHAPTTAAPALDAHTLEDIERHRNMAHAHEQAAQCLAAARPYAQCQKELQTNCKGLALGKNCGMRHAH